MNTNTLGTIHHVTAVTSDAQINLDFYVGRLGLRLVKKTVNFDDPTAYHLYYGNYLGEPGTLLTFFPYPDGYAENGRAGSATAVAFSVPKGSLPAWAERLKDLQPESFTRFGESGLTVKDPDGMRVELIESESSILPYTGGPVTEHMAISQIHSVTLAQNDLERSRRTYEHHLGWQETAKDGNRTRWTSGPDQRVVLDVLEEPTATRARGGRGSIHHVAFRTPDDATEKVWLSELTAAGYRISPQMERNYFRSLYFREPGGVLFEIATDGPGFAIDEAPESLGASLKLPEQYEPIREQLEIALPKLNMPASTANA